MVGSNSSSSSESESAVTGIRDKDLLQFYQNKFDDLKEDKYREKVDKHLKELIADRYELEAEVTRKGEKISDLQKALVDLQLSCFEERERFLTVSAENERLKKTEDLLHKNIRQLLSLTKDDILRDRIIYILQDPKVEIASRHVEGRSAGTSSSSLTKKKSSSDFLRKEIQQLQSKIDQFSKISKSNSDVVIEDCKTALEKSREKILEDEQEIRKLQKKLQESEAVISNMKNSQSYQNVENDRSSSLHVDTSKYKTYNSRSAEQLPRTRITVPSTSKSAESIYKPSDQTDRTVTSDIKDLKFSLASLLQISSKIDTLLKNIQSSQTFLLAAKKPTTKSIRECVAETNIVELQNFVRQSTRLSYDINNILRSVNEEIYKHGDVSVRHRELQQLESAVNDLAVSTAETDVLCMSLARAKFFDYLVKPVQSVSKFGVEHDNYEYVADIVTMESKVKSATVSIKTATEIVEKIERSERNPPKSKNICGEGLDSRLTGSQNKVSDSKNIHGGNRFQSENTAASFHRSEDVDRMTGVRRTRSDPIGGDDVTRKIDKTLAKIMQIERGDNLKDHELCEHLADQIRSLSDRLKSLYEEFNIKSLQDNFSEYSSVTLSKLEALARQSRDTILSAEAQISAYRSNAQELSQKLKDTEELLRESISECLGLKQKLKHSEILKEINKPKGEENEFENNFRRTRNLEQEETSVKHVDTLKKPSKCSKRPEGPYECMFCKQGPDHKLCIKKIRELEADVRKMSVELKMLSKEVKDEKKSAKLRKDEAEKVVLTTLGEKQSAKETIQSLEAKNKSLSEQLNIFKNRLKNMERYRRCEIEGFQTDIKNLKSKIKDLEKQLSQAVLIFQHDQKDLELLKSIHSTAQHAQTTVVLLKRLKSKLYQIETDMKRL